MKEPLLSIFIFVCGSVAGHGIINNPYPYSVDSRIPANSTEFELGCQEDQQRSFKQDHIWIGLVCFGSDIHSVSFKKPNINLKSKYCLSINQKKLQGSTQEFSSCLEQISQRNVKLVEFFDPTTPIQVSLKMQK